MYDSNVNVWDEEWEVGQISATTGEPVSSTNTIRTKNYIPIKPSTSYYVHSNGHSARCYFYDADKVFISPRVNRTDAEITTPSNACYMKFFVGGSSDVITTYGNDISINYPSTDHDYHAHQGTTTNISWQTEAGTVYGGDVEVVEGELMDKMNLINLDGTTQCTPSSQTSDVAVFAAAFSWNSWALHSSTPNAISNRFSTSTPSGQAGRMVMVDRYLYFVIAKSELTSIDESGARAWLNDHPTQVCYELAEPQTYQLTPTEVELLTGQNNVWSDGDVTVDYYADIQKYIDKKLG